MKVRAIGLVVVGVLLASNAKAQSTFGSIVGVTGDASGLVLPGVAVTATNLDDHNKRSTLSGADGSYQILNLRPGRYEISGQKPAFAEFKIAEARLDARQTLRVEMSLELAELHQAVQVEAAGAAINTENGTIADSKNFRQVIELPVNYRGATSSPLAAMATVPGAQQDANGNVSLGGALPSQVQYSVDGVSTVNVRANGALTNTNPSSELISEFRVTQFNNNAEFSQLGDVTIATKSGGNGLHGSAFEYHQNSAVDATIYGFDAKARKVFNTFGGSLSGPVTIPRIHQGKDRTFFFVDFEANRRRFSTPQQFSVPTLSMRRGDLNGLPGSSVVDPSTGAPFPGNRIPAGQLNPVAQSLLDHYIPLPNAGDGTDTNANHRRQLSTPGNGNGYDTRVDHALNAKQQIYGRWSWKNVDSTTANRLLPSEQNRETNRNLVVSHNYMINSRMVNEARFGLTYYTLRVLFPIDGADAVTTLGLRGLDLSDVPGNHAFPTFDFSDSTGFTAIGRDKTGVLRSRTLQFADNFSWIQGRHSLKFGADLRRLAYYDLESFGGSNDFGAFTFSAGTFSGNAFGDLLLGVPAKTYIAQSGPDVRANAFHTGLYAQDELRVNRKLTVSFGLRWQAMPPFVSELGNLTAFDKRNGGVIIPGQSAPRDGFLASINGCPGVNPALPCGPVTLAGDVGLGDGVRQFYKKNFQPRLSFAFRPFSDGKTVIRGGFGIFTMTNLGQLSFNTTNIHVSVVRTTVNGLLPDGQPAYRFPDVRTNDDPRSIAGTGDFYQNVATDYRDPQAAQWNFTVERELRTNLSLRVSYAGMNSYRMSQTVDLNQVPSSTQPYDPDARPYRNWGRILSSENLGFINYQAIQSELNKRFSNGLMFQASHSWAKNLGNVSGDAPGAFTPEVIYGTPVADRFNLGLNRGNVSGTRRQRFLLSGIYQLPFGRERAFLKHMNRIGNAVLGGWEVSTVTMVQTGPFLTPVTTASYDPANTGLIFRGAALRPDRIGNGNLSNPTPERFFDIDAFAAPTTPGRIGNAGIGILTGPGTVAVAGGLAKTFSLREGMRLRFEATFTNLPNHPNFAAPAVDVSAPSTFGKTTSVQAAENSGNRVGQFGLRLDF